MMCNGKCMTQWHSDTAKLRLPNPPSAWHIGVARQLPKLLLLQQRSRPHRRRHLESMQLVVVATEEQRPAVAKRSKKASVRKVRANKIPTTAMHTKSVHSEMLIQTLLKQQRTSKLQKTVIPIWVILISLECSVVWRASAKHVISIHKSYRPLVVFFTTRLCHPADSESSYRIFLFS